MMAHIPILSSSAYLAVVKCCWKIGNRKQDCVSAVHCMLSVVDLYLCTVYFVVTNSETVTQWHRQIWCCPVHLHLAKDLLAFPLCVDWRVHSRPCPPVWPFLPLASTVSPQSMFSTLTHSPWLQTHCVPSLNLCQYHTPCSVSFAVNCLFMVFQCCSPSTMSVAPCLLTWPLSLTVFCFYPCLYVFHC